jgi:Holliday junction DNA helicase RuvA
MFNSISGTITHKGSSVIFLENNGIEWEITASSKTIDQLPSPGNNIRVLTFLYHREDILSLFGFYEEKERHLFYELIRINGIGPKQAVKILSGISADDFISALDAENLTVLSGLPELARKLRRRLFYP